MGKEGWGDRGFLRFPFPLISKHILSSALAGEGWGGDSIYYELGYSHLG
jgi:hypothetical protein